MAPEPAFCPALALSREASCFLIPAAILGRRQTRAVTGTVTVSLSILVGMWLECFTIVVSTLSHPCVPWDKVFYFPTWVEIGITLGFGATFMFLYMLFTRFFPIVSIWEVREGRQHTLNTGMAESHLEIIMSSTLICFSP